MALLSRATRRVIGSAMRRAACLALVSLASAQAVAHDAAEDDLKAAFAYNFMVLAAWPAHTPSTLRFCVAGAGGPGVFAVLAGKAVRERSVAVDSVASPERVAACDVLYIPRAEARRLTAWTEAAAGRPILTISEQAEAQGAIVNLRRTRRQLVFDVDTGAAAAARLQLSSQMLKLAATVR